MIPGLKELRGIMKERFNALASMQENEEFKEKGWMKKNLSG